MVVAGSPRRRRYHILHGSASGAAGALALRALNQEIYHGALDVGAVLGGRVVLEGTLGASGMVLASPRAIHRFLAEAAAGRTAVYVGEGDEVVTRSPWESISDKTGG